MGCRLSRTRSIDESPVQTNENTNREENGTNGTAIKNGKSPLLRKDSPAANLDCNRNGSVPNRAPSNGGTKPIAEIESASQAEFFRMLDEKIAGGPELEEIDES
ncbi:hypothetical protein PFISCL1PPCAC_26164 [Pristionchus fissidentatus]|uniref:Uncharacterized protein n=1 Tax=Pristionchus fissidentatus TaxID=1538716 RepID=A0AAV5WS63_9BILA|nr:hypothetical protein PFISCL1PPCAC_26164 [Pristionchus fissidentatus]